MSSLHGRRWQVLSFHTSSLRRSKNLAQSASSSSLPAHLRLKYSPSVQLETQLPPCEARWRRERLFCDGDPWSARWATPLPDLRPLRQLYRHTLLCESKCRGPPAQSSVRGTHTAETDGHLDLHLRSQISTYERNPVVNKPSGPSSALGLQLGLQHLLSYLALLNSGPAWTIIPGGTAWKSHRVLSIYNQMMPTQIFTWYLTCALPVLLRSGFDCERINQKAEDVWPSSLIFASHGLSFYWALACSSQQNLKCLLRALVHKHKFRGRRPSRARLLPPQQLGITGHSLCRVGFQFRPGR